MIRSAAASRCAIQAITKVEAGDDGRGHRRQQHARFHRRKENRIAQDEIIIVERSLRSGEKNGCEGAKERLPDHVNSGSASARANIARCRARPAAPRPELDARRSVALAVMVAKDSACAVARR